MSRRRAPPGCKPRICRDPRPRANRRSNWPWPGWPNTSWPTADGASTTASAPAAAVARIPGRAMAKAVNGATGMALLPFIDHGNTHQSRPLSAERGRRPAIPDRADGQGRLPLGAGRHDVLACPGTVGAVRRFAGRRRNAGRGTEFTSPPSRPRRRRKRAARDEPCPPEPRTPRPAVRPLSSRRSEAAKQRELLDRLVPPRRRRPWPLRWPARTRAGRLAIRPPPPGQRHLGDRLARDGPAQRDGDQPADPRADIAGRHRTCSIPCKAITARSMDIIARRPKRRRRDRRSACCAASTRAGIASNCSAGSRSWPPWGRRKTTCTTTTTPRSCCITTAGRSGTTGIASCATT